MGEGKGEDCEIPPPCQMFCTALMCCFPVDPVLECEDPFTTVYESLCGCGYGALSVEVPDEESEEEYVPREEEKFCRTGAAATDGVALAATGGAAAAKEEMGFPGRGGGLRTGPEGRTEKPGEGYTGYGFLSSTARDGGSS